MGRQLHGGGAITRASRVCAGRTIGRLVVAAMVIATCAVAPGVAAATPSVRDVCAAPSKPHTYRCLSLVRTDRTAKPEARIRSAGDSFPPTYWYGYGPAELQRAYGLTSASALDGSGATVAIIDAYDDPAAESDLAVYRSAAGLPPCTTASQCFHKLNEHGLASPLPPAAGATGWDLEESLDIDMVSAICPNCKIDLIEARSNSDADLDAAANTGAALADFESNSYGGAEYFGESSEDVYFDHPGKVITASAGDDDYGTEYPASSPDVVAVGGTSLMPAANARGWMETVWGPDAGGLGWGTGSGCSAYEPKPAWQTDAGCANRTVADVSMDADPDTGVAVYDTYSENGWVDMGGTSASSPMVASVYALAGTPKAGTNPAAYPYGDAADLNDVSSGTNSGSGCSPAYLCMGEPGYDGPTGLGTPDGIDAFMSSPPAKVQVQPPSATISSPASGQTFTVGQVVPTTFSCAGGSGGPGLASCDDSNGADTSSGGRGVLNTSRTGSFTYTVNATSASGATAIASIGYTVAAKPAPAADLTISIGGPRRAKAGTAFVVRIRVANAGPATATHVLCAITIPRGVRVAHATGARRRRGAVRWGPRSLASGRHTTYQVRFKVRAHANRRVMIHATARSTQVPDPRPTDDAARIPIRLHAPARRRHAGNRQRGLAALPALS